ncbi:MAG: potassium transporter [Acidimicrobiales bacterium]|nr:MAG: potassium transporter [Acidimicrobiales bacterium]
MTTLRKPRMSASLELQGGRASSYSRLAAADAGLALGTVSVACGLAGLVDDGGDGLLLIGVGLAAMAIGLVARRSLERRHRSSPSRLLTGLALSWTVLVLLGTLIYLATGTIDRVDDALVESAAGFSTTSLTTLDPSTLSIPMQLWRAATQWIGGLLGIIVGVVTLPLILRGAMPGSQGARHVAEQIAPTPLIGRRRIIGIYAAVTTLIALGYAATGLGATDSVAHAFSTASTGGFSTRADSFAGLGTGPRTVAVLGMLVGGASYALIWWAIRGRTKTVWRSTELRLYLGLIAAASVVVALGSEASAGEAIFTTVSALSTTGFAVGEWTLLPDSVLMILLVLIGTGAMSGSAGGGLRLIRAWTLVGFASREMRRQLDPHSVVVVKQAGEPIQERTLDRTTGYQIGHLGVCGAAATLLALAGQDLLPAIYTGISVVSTHGPGIGPGAFGDLSDFSPVARVILIPFMLAGRLTILPLLLAVSYAFRIENAAVRRVRRSVQRLVRR